MADKLKITVAISLIVASIVAFYYYPEQSTLLRVLGIVVASVVGAAIYLQTASGKGAWAFVQDSKQEMRKVVWPTRKETMQTTGMVIVMVILVAIFLWVLDMLLLWGIQVLTRQGA